MTQGQGSATQAFSGRTAVVTGAARGIGRAIAGEIQAQGARLVLVDRDASQLARTAAELQTPGRPPVEFHCADLADPAQVAALGETIASSSPRIDVLVNNAGIEVDLPFDQVNAETFDRVIAVNLRAPLLVTQALVGLFPPEGGAIVNIASIHSDHAFANSLPYACSKAGLVALTRNLALELAARNVRVNAVCPGYIDTQMWDEWLALDPNPEELAARTSALHPLGRRGKPEDVANVVAFLASGSTPWVTGTTLVIDGGLTIRTHP